MPNEKTVDELREEIRKLTNRIPTSQDATYLTNRLADLKAAKKAGEDVKKHYAQPNSILNASMPASCRAAVKRMAEDDGIGVSELVRLALGEYAKKHGHTKAVAAFFPGEA
jgi:radical SAM superfamily enzyme YgiQ (UPF0313 family)